MTIFTERKGKEEPDILALDKNGDLYIFELKRWGSDQENLLQVLRYGQLFAGVYCYSWPITSPIGALIFSPAPAPDSSDLLTAASLLPR